MNRTQLEHIIRAASAISGDSEIVVVGSQAINAQAMKLPAAVFQSLEADVYPRNHPERADDIDAAIGELSHFHQTHGYYAHGVSPRTAILPDGWEQRLIRLSNPNTGGATGLCLDLHDLVLSKYAAGRRRLARLARAMPVDKEVQDIIVARIKFDYASGSASNGKVLPTHKLSPKIDPP